MAESAMFTSTKSNLFEESAKTQKETVLAKLRYSHLYWNWDSRYICHFLRMFGHAKFQLSTSCTFKVMKVYVVYLVISTECLITMKVQEIESWNFACPNILKRCAWRPNFSHFSWEMTKISTVPVQHRCPTFIIGHNINFNMLLTTLKCYFNLNMSF